MIKDVLRLLFQLLDYNDDEKLVQANLMDLLNDNLKQAGWADVYYYDYIIITNLNNLILKPFFLIVPRLVNLLIFSMYWATFMLETKISTSIPFLESSKPKGYTVELLTRNSFKTS